MLNIFAALQYGTTVILVFTQNCFRNPSKNILDEPAQKEFNVKWPINVLFP